MPRSEEPALRARSTASLPMWPSATPASSRRRGRRRTEALGRRMLAEALFSRIEVLGAREATIHPTDAAVAYGFAAAIPDRLDVTVGYGRGERSRHDDIDGVVGAARVPPAEMSGSGQSSDEETESIRTVVRELGCVAASQRLAYPRGRLEARRRLPVRWPGRQSASSSAAPSATCTQRGITWSRWPFPSYASEWQVGTSTSSTSTYAGGSPRQRPSRARPWRSV